ncbi:hypothetical protein [Streptomyces sp. NPDC058683]|uniref:hypothetical protein n=1 Tax=Streptomyces sp. NPDC058683 TaxID=3346597 RepID=UPI003653E87E
MLATTALASSDHGTRPQAVEQSQTGAAKPEASFGHKPVAGNPEHSRATTQKTAKTKASSGDGTKPQISEENRLLLEIQKEIKVSTVGPTAAQVARADKLVGQLKAEGRATAAQLAWLALTPAQKRAEAAPVGTD